MKKNLNKTYLKLIASIIFALTLVVSIVPETVLAHYYVPKGCNVYDDNIVNIDNVGRVSYTADNRTMTIEFYDVALPDGASAVYRCSCDNQDNWGVIENGKATLTHSIANHKGQNSINFWIRKDSNSDWHHGNSDYNVLSNGKVGYYSEAGKSEAKFVDMLDSLNPEDYRGLSDLEKKLTNLSKMKKTVKKITKGKKEDSEKIKAIHDWIAKNVQYDHYALRLCDEGKQQDYNDDCAAGWVYKNKKAVCTGYSQLTKVFCGIAGIPCVVVYGDTGITHNEARTSYPKHAWNAIYSEGEWKIYDVTWDCQNKYYGPGDSSNTKNKKPVYNYYAISPGKFGKDHFSFFEFGYSNGELIDFESPERCRIVDEEQKQLVLTEARATDKEYEIWQYRDTEYRFIKGGQISYTIVGIAPEAFATSPRTKTLKIYYNRTLEKERIKDCLKGSKITKVIINSTYCSGRVDEYKEWFSDASLVGKSVQVVVE